MLVMVLGEKILAKYLLIFITQVLTIFGIDHIMVGIVLVGIDLILVGISVMVMAILVMEVFIALTGIRLIILATAMVTEVIRIMLVIME